MGGHWTYDGGTPFQASAVDREFIDEMFSGTGAVIVGRRMYGVVDGWVMGSGCSRTLAVACDD